MENNKITPIQTYYKGYLFRSRNEARWAVFFDALFLHWEYEREGFPLKSGNFLPDFWLPHQEMWIELKPEYPDQYARAKCHELAHYTQKTVFAFVGPPSPVSRESAIAGYGGYVWIPETKDHDYWWQSPDGFEYYWAICPNCDDVIPLSYHDSEDGKHPCACCLERNLSPYELDELIYNGQKHPKIIRAVQAARSARFEHGESGAPR